MVKKIVMFVLAFLALMSYKATAQEKMKLSATIETTTSSVVQSAKKSPSPGIVLFPTRWTTSQQVMTIEAAPTAKLTVDVKFDIGGRADNPPTTKDPETGKVYRPDNVVSYNGNLRRFEVSASYQIWRNVSIVGGYMKFSTDNNYENMIPYGYLDGGLVTSYNEKQTYQSLEFGAAGKFAWGKLEMNPGFLFYPRVGRNFLSHQNYLGEVFDNNIDMKQGKRMGVQLTGNASYQLVSHLAATVAVNYQRIRTQDTVGFGGSSPESLSTRTMLVGLKFGF